jgi:hypothetical protein
MSKIKMCLEIEEAKKFLNLTHSEYQSVVEHCGSVEKIYDYMGMLMGQKTKLEHLTMPESLMMDANDE